MGTQISINGKVIYLKNDNVTIDQIKNSENLKENIILQIMLKFKFYLMVLTEVMN